MTQKIKYGSEEIKFKLEFSDRKTLGITVFPDRSTLVKAPSGSSMEKIEEKVRKKAGWIIKQKDHFLSFEPRNTQRLFVSGETHFYLGRQYQLQILESKINKVKLKGALLEVHIPEKKLCQKVLEEWYLEKAKYWFNELTAPLISNFQKYGVNPKNLEIRKMSNRWGSCSPKGKILLNPELVKAPKACIEYVIVHELCHLVHRDHTNAFFKLQEKEFPQWQKWKQKLEMLLA